MLAPDERAELLSAPADALVDLLSEALADNYRLTELARVDVTDLAEARMLLAELAILAGPKVDQALAARIRRLMEE